MITNSSKKLSAHNQRLEMINFFYHHFVMNYNLKQTEKFFLSKKSFNSYQKETFNFLFLNFPKITALIKQNLSQNWSFAEISNFDKAVLIVLIGEFYLHKLPKRVVINEGVKLVQTFGVFDNYAYINKILEKILEEKERAAFLF